MTDDVRSDRDPVEFLAEEILERYRRGDRPAITEYIQRYPKLEDEIRELFPILLYLEQVQEDTETPAANNRAFSCPDQIGDYRIIREIGRGGMGIVYEAEQQSLGRHVALKVLPTQVDQNHHALERFRREARAAANLHHTNIVPVFEVGQEGTTSFYAMQFIEGQPLDAVIHELSYHVAGEERLRATWLHPRTGRRTSLSSTVPDQGPGAEANQQRRRETSKPTEVSRPGNPPAASTEIAISPSAATIMSRAIEGPLTEADYQIYFRNVASIANQISEALAYAHARGVVHRDIKPSNLILDTKGVIWVTDFGMAKTDAEPLTRTGDIVGTIHYMAPERFRGQCDARADIYAAGLTLYELLALKPAFEAADRLRLMELIAHQDPARPRSINPRIPRDLETVVLKAIDKDPARRYQSAAELSEDLECFLEDRPIRARRVSLPERFIRWTRRNPVLSGMSVAIVLILLIGLLGATTTAVMLKQSTDRAVEAELDAKATAEEVLQQSYVNWVNLAYLESRNDLARAQEYLSRCPLDRRGWEWQFVSSQCQVELRSVQENGQSVNCLDFSPDGKWMAVGTGNFLNRRGPPGDLIVRNVSDSQTKFIRPGLANGLTAVKFSPNGSQIATANGSTLTVWDADTGEPRYSIEGDELDLLCLAYSPDGSRIAGGFGRFNGSHVGYALLWNARTGEQIGEPLPGRAGGVWDLDFDPAGTRIATANEGRVNIWDLQTRELVADLVADTGFIYCVQFHPDGQHIAAGGLDRSIRLWEIETRQIVKTYVGHTGFVRGLAFSADGTRMISASEDKSLRLWGVQSERELTTFHGHTHFVNCVAFSPDGRIIASGGLDRTVKVWFAASEHQLVYEGHLGEGHVRALAFNPTSHALASGSLRFSGPTGRLHYWDTHSGRRLLQFPQHVDEVSSLAFRHDGQRIAAGHVSGLVTIWDAKTAELVLRLDAHVAEVQDVAYSPDGSLVASVGQDRAVNIWDADTGLLLRTATGHQDLITSVEFSPDGETIATGSEDGTIRIWDTASANSLLTIRHPAGEVRSLVYSPDGQQLISTGGIDHRQGDVLIWDAKSGQQITNLHGHTDIVYDVSFSPDGTRFATASDDRTIKLWDAETLREVFTIRGHTGGVLAVKFSPDGEQLASGSVDRTVRIWSLSQPDANVYFQREAATEFVRGQSLLERQQWEEAVAAFREASGLGYEGIELHLALATALRQSGDLEAAHEQIQTALDRAPEDARLLASLGIDLARRGHHREAVRAIDRALGLASDNPHVLAAAGRVHAVAGQSNQADNDFSQARQLQSALSESDAWWSATGWWSAGPASERTGDENQDLPSIKTSPVEQLVAGTEADESQVDPAQVDPVQWSPLQTDGDGYINLIDAWETDPANNGYAIQHIFASVGQPVAMLVGADNGIRLWLNDQLVLEQAQSGRARIDQIAISGELHPGWNTLRAELANRNGRNGFYLRISDHARDRARGAMRRGQLDEVLQIWSAASEAEQDDIHLLDIAGNAYARKGQWPEAVQVFERLVKRQPTRNRNWFLLAPLLIHTQQFDRYSAFRRDLLMAFGDEGDPIMSERTSKASLLIPVPLAAARLPSRLASEAAVAGASHALLPYFLFANGSSRAITASTKRVGATKWVATVTAVSSSAAIHAVHIGITVGGNKTIPDKCHGLRGGQPAIAGQEFGTTDPPEQYGIDHNGHQES